MEPAVDGCPVSRTSYGTLNTVNQSASGVSADQQNQAIESRCHQHGDPSRSLIGPVAVESLTNCVDARSAPPSSRRAAALLPPR